MSVFLADRNIKPKIIRSGGSVATLYDDGSFQVEKNGRLHRVNGPAAYYAGTGTFWYYENGHEHRESGPAVDPVLSAFYKEYWVNGEFVRNEQVPVSSELVAYRAAEGAREFDGLKNGQI